MDYGYYDYGYDVGSAAGIIGAVAIIWGIVMIVSIVAIILMFIGQWKCFKKAGYKGWECLIEGHNQFVNCTLAGVNPILVLILVFGAIVLIIPFIGWIVYFGFLVYYQAVIGINTAKVFGKGIGFGIALAIPLSAPIAWFILGNKDVKYVGTKTNDDVKESNVKPEQPTEQPTVHPNNCPNCGAAVNSNDRFCMYCGKQL